MGQKKIEIYEDLVAGRDPREGQWDPAVLKEGRTKGMPLMGAAVPHPDWVSLQFTFHDPTAGATILAVQISVPERVVHLPVPGWVVEDIWQGEVRGTFMFESEAKAAVEDFLDLLEPGNNAALFGPAGPKRRE